MKLTCLAMLLACGCVGAEPDTTTTPDPLTLRTNYALGKPTLQSTTYPGGDSGHAVDGNTSGVWTDASVTHTQLGYQNWWQVDLQQVRNVGVIDVYGRTDPCCTSRLSNYYVLTSMYPFPSTDLATTLANPYVKSLYVSGQSPLPFAEVAPNGLARYVRIQLTGTDYLSLAEVQVLDVPNVIAGPDRVATATSWVATGTATASTGIAMTDIDGSLRTYQRGSNGYLQESSDLGLPHDLAAAPAITTDAVAAFTDGNTGRAYVAARSSMNQIAIGEHLPATDWTFSYIPGGSTDGPPAIAIACGHVYAAARFNGQMQVWARALSGGSWSLAATYYGVRTPPTLAASPDHDLGLAFTTTDNWIRFARGTCASGGAMGPAITPGGTSFSATRLGLGAYGDLFGVAVLGTDNRAYFAMQRRDANGAPSWAGFEVVQWQVQDLIESPVVTVYRGLFHIAARDTSKQMRYWVRSANSLAPLSNEYSWLGGNVVGGAGTGDTAPTFAVLGHRTLQDNYGHFENAAGELYVATKGIGDQQLYMLNYGRFATWNVLAIQYGVKFDTKFEANDVDPRVVGNFPDFLPAFMMAPARYWGWVARPTACGVPLTILLSTNYVAGWTNMGCGVVNGGDGRTYALPTFLINAVKYPAWTIWEEEGHVLQAAVPNFKSQLGYTPTFTNLSPRACTTDADCGGATCDFGCVTGRCPSGAGAYTTTRVCQAPGTGQSAIRPLGYVDWYDLTQDEHSFLNFVEWYRWWGDELRDMRDYDYAHGSTLLRDKYLWVKNYYDGVEFNGRHDNTYAGNREAGSYGAPLQ